MLHSKAMRQDGSKAGNSPAKAHPLIATITHDALERGHMKRLHMCMHNANSSCLAG